MSIERCSAIVEMRGLNSTYKYNNVDVMTLHIEYPIIKINNNLDVEEKINKQIRIQIENYLEYATYILFDQAINFYKESIKNNSTFFQYVVYIEYVITYNENCFLSLYSSNYEFKGEEHGDTRRTSNTWELCTGASIYLYNFFKPETNYTFLLVQDIIKQVEKNVQDNQIMYFDDYKEIIFKLFNPNNFFMSPDGITIYYHQYDLGPFSTGINEFTVPYETIGWFPSC